MHTPSALLRIVKADKQPKMLLKWGCVALHRFIHVFGRQGVVRFLLTNQPACGLGSSYQRIYCISWHRLKELYRNAKQDIRICVSYSLVSYKDHTKYVKFAINSGLTAPL
jgi:hypothetical protein